VGLGIAVESTVEQMKNMALVLRLALGDTSGPNEREARELLGELGGVLGKLAALAERSAPESWPEGSIPGAANTLPSCDLVEVVQRARERHARLFEPEIRFVQELQAPRAVVPMSARRMERILFDLLERARDVTPDGGLVVLRLEAGDTFVRLTVQDGATISAATSAGESGLELIAFWWRLLGLGNLTVQSRPGQGTSFVLTLPALLGAPARAATVDA
jgi:signal transduction histidine kinase